MDALIGAPPPFDLFSRAANFVVAWWLAKLGRVRASRERFCISPLPARRERARRARMHREKIGSMQIKSPQRVTHREWRRSPSRPRPRLSGLLLNDHIR